MELDPALEKYLAEELAKGDDALLHLSISGRHAGEQALLYARRLLDMRNMPVQIGDIAFTAAKQSEAVATAFREGEGGVVIIRDAHGLSQPGQGHQLLRTMLSQSWDNGKTILVFAGARKGFDAYFAQMPEMRQRQPHAHDIPDVLTPQQLAEQQRRETIGKWRGNGVLDVSAGAEAEAPTLAAFPKKTPPVIR